MRKHTYVIFLIFLFLALVASIVVAGGYGGGRYGVGDYGVGEDRGGASGAGAAVAGGGSSSSASVRDSGESSISLMVPNDLDSDVAETSLSLVCLSTICRATANELLDLPPEVSSATYEGVGEFVSAVRLECTGDIGSSTANINIDSGSAVCGGLRVSHVDGGVADDASVDCTDNDDGSLGVVATFNGCGDYLVVWQEAEQEVFPTVESTEETVGVEGEGLVSETGVQGSAGIGGIWIVLLILVALAVIIIAYRYVKGRKKKF